MTFLRLLITVMGFSDHSAISSSQNRTEIKILLQKCDTAFNKALYILNELCVCTFFKQHTHKFSFFVYIVRKIKSMGTDIMSQSFWKFNNRHSQEALTWFWCLCWWQWTDFTHCSSVSIVDFEQVNAGWFMWKIL